ncbi:MAG TPA: hypothetical protein PLC54_04570 [Spirochaetales bacterium]|nr:hypothetical protein [Spirochaetales bacterium]
MAKVDLNGNLLAGLVAGLHGNKAERKKETPKTGAFRSILKEAERSDATPAALASRIRMPKLQSYWTVCIPQAMP